jgi:hypothetical protein
VGPRAGGRARGADPVGHRHDLLVDARIDDRTAEDRLLSQSVLVLMTTMALACDAVLLLVVWGLQLIGRRSYGALRVLVPTGVLALVAVAIAQGLVAGGATRLDRTAFLVQAGLIVLATGALLSRSSRAWLRAGTG